MLTTALYDGLVHFLGAKLVSKTLPSSKLVSGQGSAISENLGRGEVQSINIYTFGAGSGIQVFFGYSGINGSGS